MSAQKAHTVLSLCQNPAYAERFDYYYVPTYYVEGKKMHEGVATKEKVEAVLRSALHV